MNQHNKKKQSDKLSNYFCDAGKKIRTSTEKILHKILSLARLPIPPYPHARSTIHINKNNFKQYLGFFRNFDSLQIYISYEVELI